MKMLIAGSGGQLGRALVATAAPGSDVAAPAEADFDILSDAMVADVVARVRPDVIVNAAAYTAVDRAETDAATARAVNATAAGRLAAAAAGIGARFVHVSTDFIFDGTSATPYRVDAAAAPLGVYGQTKLEGEHLVRAAHDRALIVRTAWVYAAAGNNFVKTMLRLMAERDEVRVVADQIGTPTHADGLARAIRALMAAEASGTMHWTDAGVASWYDFAVAIQEEAIALGLLARPARLLPIATIDYPTPARRPACSVLDKSATWAITGPAPHWRTALRQCLGMMKEMQP